MVNGFKFLNSTSAIDVAVEPSDCGSGGLWKTATVNLAAVSGLGPKEVLYRGHLV